MLPSVSASQICCGLSFLLFFLLAMQILHDEEVRLGPSGTAVQELLVNGDFGLGMTYWRPFHWFGFYAVDEKQHYVGRPERSLLLLVQQRDGAAASTVRTAGIFQFVDRRRADGEQADVEAEAADSDWERQLRDGELVQMYRLEAALRLTNMLSGARFRLVLRGQSADGERMVEREAHLDASDVLTDALTDEAVVQSVCVELESAVQFRYLAVYVFLSGPAQTAVQLHGVSLLTWQKALDPLRGHRDHDDNKDDDDDDEKGTVGRALGDGSYRHACGSYEAEFVDEEEYRVHAFFFQSKGTQQRSQADGVTIATQLTTDRLELLTDMYRLWEGPMSVVLYVSDLMDLFRLEEFRRSTAGVAEHIDVHVVYADTVPQQGGQRESLYPINFLRQVALQYVATEFVLTLDVDFLPSPGLLKSLRPFLSAGDAGTGYVLPAFEIDGLRYMLQLPRSKVDLLRLVAAGTARQIHVNMAPESQRATNYERWAGSDHPYLASYEPHYEPFFVMSTARARFDTRFKGYGFDKASQAYALSRQGFKFLVLPQAYIAHRDHGVPAWRQQMPGIATSVWSNIYEFVFETEIAARADASWVKLWHDQFDWLDLSNWDDIDEWNGMEPPQASFTWTPAKLVLLGVLLVIVWRHHIRNVFTAIREAITSKQLKST